MAINPAYFFSEAASSFRRNWVMSLGAVITIFFSLLLVGTFVVTGLVINSVVESVEQKVQVTIFLKDGYAPEDLEALQSDLAADPRVKSVVYVSKEEALERFKEQTAESPEIVEQLSGNPLPASLELELVDPEQVHEVVADIKAHPNFPNLIANPDDPEKDLKYGQDIVDKLFSLTQAIRVILVILVALLAFVSMIFISNTIRLAIYARRKEIGIMRLVGASNWFIRTPFLLEGVMQGLIGAILAVGIIIAVRAWAVPWLAENLPFLPIDLSAGVTVQISLILLAFGVLIGIVGSGFALRRYLRV
ncbi:MAG: permease-like cell division protein FtsX [Coriobacteriia bacterium]